MWALVGELPAHTALWATPARLPGGPSQRRIRRGRRRQLRSRCQLALHQPLPAAAEPVSELGWGLAEGRYVLVRTQILLCCLIAALACETTLGGRAARYQLWPEGGTDQPYDAPRDHR